MIQIVFSDIDGTLLDSRHRLTPLTRQAIHGLAGQGVPFVIVSARSPSGIYPILKEYGLRCPIISYSGGLILDEERQVLLHQGFPKAMAREVTAFLEAGSYDMTWCVYSYDQWIAKDKSDPRVIEEERIVKAVSVQGDVDSVAADEVSKILCLCAPGQIEALEAALKAAFPLLSIVKSSDTLLEIMAQGINKAVAVKKLCALRDIPVEEAAAFGDNYNDLEMLTAVGHGVLMGNAPRGMKERIAVHTEDNDHDGIYHALVKMGLGPISLSEGSVAANAHQKR